MRLQPIAPEELNPDQKALYESMSAGVNAKYSSFQTQREDGALLGPWNAWLHDPVLGSAFWKVTQALTQERRIPDGPRQVAILAVGAHFNAAYELYAHVAVAREKLSMSERRLATLASGNRPEDFDDAEALAFDTATSLLRGGPLPELLYKRCTEVFGQPGVNELIYLVGHYCFVSLTLNGFALGTPELSTT